MDIVPKYQDIDTSHEAHSSENELAKLENIASEDISEINNKKH